MPCLPRARCQMRWCSGSDSLASSRRWLPIGVVCVVAFRASVICRGLTPLGVACLTGQVQAAKSLLLGMAPVRRPRGAPARPSSVGASPDRKGRRGVEVEARLCARAPRGQSPWPPVRQVELSHTCVDGGAQERWQSSPKIAQSGVGFHLLTQLVAWQRPSPPGVLDTRAPSRPVGPSSHEAPTRSRHAVDVPADWRLGLAMGVFGRTLQANGSTAACVGEAVTKAWRAFWGPCGRRAYRLATVILIVGGVVRMAGDGVAGPPLAAHRTGAPHLSPVAALHDGHSRRRGPVPAGGLCASTRAVGGRRVPCRRPSVGPGGAPRFAMAAPHGARPPPTRGIGRPSCALGAAHRWGAQRRLADGSAT